MGPPPVPGPPSEPGAVPLGDTASSLGHKAEAVVAGGGALPEVCWEGEVGGCRAADTVIE